MKKIKTSVKGIITVAALDLVAISLATVLAILTWDKTVPLNLNLLWWFLANLALSYAFLITFRMYYFMFDTVGLIDTLKLLGVALLVFAIGCTYACLLKGVGLLKHSIYSVFFFLFTLAIRYSKRIYVALKYSVTKANKSKIRAMIVGAGNAGATLIREIQTSDKIDYNPVCVIDDDESKVGKRINNVKIVGTTAEIEKYAEKYAIEEILISIPSENKDEVKRI